MPNRRFALLALSLCAIFPTVHAGPLTPPPGSPAPTAKPLAEVEPRVAINATNTPGDPDSVFRITQPGSYYLTGNLVGQSGKRGIEIAADGVTIDLSGFAVIGVIGSLEGIAAEVGSDNAVVGNGVVRGWGSSGVDLENGSMAHDLVVEDNDGSGIQLALEGVIRNCVARLNGSAGLAVAASGSVLDSVSARNGPVGISVSTGSVVSRCVAAFNAGTGVSSGSDCLVVDTTARSNGGSGFSLGNACVVSACSARENDGVGISVQVSGVVLNCVSYFNGSHGILASTGSLIVGNVSQLNGTATADGTGIRITGGDTRVEGNNMSRNDVGLAVIASGNLVLRNNASGNAINWNIVAGNAVAPIVLATTNPAVINGSTYTGSLGTTDPNANITH